MKKCLIKTNPPHYFEGKGLFCPDHSPDPGTKRQYSGSLIAVHLAQSLGIDRAEIVEFLYGLSALAAQEVVSTGEFNLPGLGRLVMAERKERTGRNPQTGEEIEIPARTTVKFKVSKKAKAALSSE